MTDIQKISIYFLPRAEGMLSGVQKAAHQNEVDNTKLIAVLEDVKNLIQQAQVILNKEIIYEIQAN